MHITSQYLVSEEKAVMATSKVEAMGAEASCLRKDLIVAMDENNSSKERIKTLIEELNAEKHLVKQRDEQLGGQPKNEECRGQDHPCFSTHGGVQHHLVWYFKGFELLRRCVVKHGPGVEFEGLEFEAIDKEIKADEAAQASQVAAVAGDDPLESEKDGNDAPTTSLYYLFLSFFFFSFFVWVPCMFWGF